MVRRSSRLIKLTAKANACRHRGDSSESKVFTKMSLSSFEGQSFAWMIATKMMPDYLITQREFIPNASEGRFLIMRCADNIFVPELRQNIFEFGENIIESILATKNVVGTFDEVKTAVLNHYNTHFYGGRWS